MYDSPKETHWVRWFWIALVVLKILSRIHLRERVHFWYSSLGQAKTHVTAKNPKSADVNRTPQLSKVRGRRLLRKNKGSPFTLLMVAHRLDFLGEEWEEWE